MWNKTFYIRKYSKAFKITGGYFYMKKIVLLVVIVLVLAFGIGMTAKAAFIKEEGKSIRKEQYHIMEEEYKKEAKMILLEKGCKNAGITLTYVTDAEGNREYVITVHHSRLDKMDAQELTLLEARLRESGSKMLMTDISLKKI